MILQGAFTVRSPRQKVFDFLLDPASLSRCIDDPHTIEVQNASRFRGTLKSGIGPVRGTFTWAATVVERESGEHARIKVHGTGMGSAFDIDALIQLSNVQGTTTASWKADVTLSGTIASLGARLMQSTVDKKTQAFFENVRKKLEAS